MKSEFLANIGEKARSAPARIVFPESEDERTVAACKEIERLGTARPILLAHPFAPEAGILARYAQALFELRKEKGLTMNEAAKLMKNRNYFAVMMVALGDADGLITGATCPSSETLRPVLQIIKTKERFHKVSGFFFMIWEKRLLLFADCMVNIEPSSEELAEIAIDTAETARRFGLEPRIAMLSFSTNGSAKHPNADRVREAAKRVHYFRPDILCEGEMQVDAALVPAVCRQKFPASKIMGTANVLIFPNLDAANIAYKLVERLGGAHALGPVLQGLAKPVNDLSRGCSVEDIVHLAAITSVEAQQC